jgi:acyl-[acyl-carrier-protein]-phospholipid O-acyltransferase / long-chain-fatty-acid--[acyl-carrier-protein] ligase
MLKTLKIPGFISFLFVAFFNAFVDLGHKIIIQNTVFKLYDGTTQVIITAFLNALILIPFVLLFTPSGFLSDRFAKPRVMVIAAAIAVGLTLGITFCYYHGYYYAAFTMTLILAAQSAIYSPAKYGYIRELTGDNHISAGNAFLQGITIIAILSSIGGFSGFFESMLAKADVYNAADIIQTIAPLGWVLVGCSLVELWLASRLPTPETTTPPARFDKRAYWKGHYLKANLDLVTHKSIIFSSVIALSAFWSISQMLAAAFPAHGKENLGINDTLVINGILAASGIGIAIGAWLAGIFSRDRIQAGLIPIGAIGMALALLGVMLTSTIGVLVGLFTLVGVFGALMIVPLNSLIQFHAKPDHLGMTIAGNNWVQNVSMLGFLVVTMLFALSGLNSLMLLGVIALLAVALTVYTLRYHYQEMIYFLAERLVKQFYNVNVQGKIPETGGVLILANHVSFLDWAMVELGSSRRVSFVMDKIYYDSPYLHWFIRHFDAIPISRSHTRSALDQVRRYLQEGKVVCLFPEGGISYNGQMAAFKKGFEKAATDTGATIIPCYIHGLWGSRFSRAPKDFRRRNRKLQKSWGRRPVRVAFGEPQPDTTNADTVRQQILELSADAWHTPLAKADTLPRAWLATVKKYRFTTAMSDGHTRTLSQAQAYAVAGLLSRTLRQYPTEHIGIMLPPSPAAMLVTMATLMAGKIPVHLNVTAPVATVRSACEQAGITTVISAKRVQEKLEKRGIDFAAMTTGVEVVSMELMAASLSSVKKLFAWAEVILLPKWLLALQLPTAQADDTAALMFSSGSEGTPKGIMLSHRNFITQSYQICHVLAPIAQERIMGALPFFHVMGLSVTGFLPLLAGIPVVYHPDPTNIRGIAKAIADFKATFYCTTATFLRMFSTNRKISPEMLQSLRYVLAGAERLDEKTALTFREKFGVSALEGYGATETAPVISANFHNSRSKNKVRQQANKPGSTGQPLPGTAVRVMDPETFEPCATTEHGLIAVTGPQVMYGYYQAMDKTASVIKTLDNRRWYLTGDKGYVDEDGFLYLVDRYSRFAKIGGEMVSLGQVEQSLHQHLEADIAVIAIPDPKKGEALVLFYAGVVEEQTVADAITTLPPLLRPRSSVALDVIPTLGSGKTDYTTLKTLA